MNYYIKLKDICHYYSSRPETMNIWLEQMRKGAYGEMAVIWSMEQRLGDWQVSELSPSDKQYLHKRLTALINSNFKY